MARHMSGVDLAGIDVDRTQPVPLFRQIYAAVRDAVLEGRLKSGSRLPSSRALARQLDVSRLTVVNALDQLVAEGYLDPRRGSGTFVADVHPPLGAVGRGERAVASDPAGAPPVSRRGAVIAELLRPLPVPPGETAAFTLGLPAVDLFPTDDWARAIRTAARVVTGTLLGYGEPAGYKPLREAIAAYLGQARGVNCTADQVMIVAGTQQALNLAVHVLTDPGDPVWIEDPGYFGARFAAASGGCTVLPVSVDAQGLRIPPTAAGPNPRLVYVTPSHQFPLGMTMSLVRRLTLIEWAHRTGAVILEDDSSSEFRHTGRPLAALQGLDRHDRVLYMGTFSKVLCPALRLAYLVVPRPLLPAFAAARIAADRHSPLIEQAAVATFMANGCFARHLTRMRSAYRERQDALIAALGRRLAGLVDARPAETGLHLVGWLPPALDDQAASRAAASAGIEAQPLSRFRIQRAGPPGLVLGFGAVPVPAIAPAVTRLAAALERLSVRPPKSAAPAGRAAAG